MERDPVIFVCASSEEKALRLLGFTKYTAVATLQDPYAMRWAVTPIQRPLDAD